MAFILFVFIILSLFLGSFPFVLILSVDINTTRRYLPSSDDGTLFYGYFLHIVSTLMTAQCILFAISMKLLKTRKDTEMCRKMKIAACINGVVIIVESLLIFLIGILYIINTIDKIYMCSLVDYFSTDGACITICKKGDGGTDGTRANCSRFLLDIRENTPVELFCVTCVILILVFGAGHYFLYKMFD
jgi:hypothetical protein